MRFQLRVDNWRSYIPLADVLIRYRRADLSHDLLAGLVVGVVTVPQAIAYAFLADLPAETGLYACLAPLVIYAVFGSSAQMSVGPVAITALMVASALGQYGPRYDDAYLGIATALSLQAGLMLWFLRLSRMGGLVNLLSQPVIVGFVNAAAVLIVISQLPALTGLAGSSADKPFSQIRSLLGDLPELNVATFLLGLACLGGLVLISRYGAAALRLVRPSAPDHHPITRTGPVLVTVLAALAVVLLDLDDAFGVAVVGFVPAGLPSLSLPNLQLQLWLDLAPSAAMIALVSYVESYSIGSTMATRQRTRVNSHQELIALGAANVGAAFTGAFPVAGSFSRSSVNYQAGARTQVSGLVAAAVIALSLLLFTPLFAVLPHAALAAIVLVSVIGIVDIRSIRKHWRIYRHDSLTELATLITALAFNVETGLITGVALSIAFFVRQSSRPHITEVGRIANSEHFRGTRRYDVETFPHAVALRIDENIIFANANQVENKLLKIVQRRPGTRHVLLVCSAVNMIDVTGLELLYRINQNFEAMGIKLHLSEVKGPVMEQLEASDFLARLTGTLFFTTHQAMRDLGTRR